MVPAPLYAGMAAPVSRLIGCQPRDGPVSTRAGSALRRVGPCPPGYAEDYVAPARSPTSPGRSDNPGCSIRSPLSSRHVHCLSWQSIIEEIVMKTCLVIAAALAGWSVQASAQDFSGPSVGVQAGWNRTDVRLPEADNGIPGVDRTTDAFVGGAFVAYDYEVAPRVVIGGQAEFNVAASDDSIAIRFLWGRHTDSELWSGTRRYRP